MSPAWRRAGVKLVLTSGLPTWLAFRAPRVPHCSCVPPRPSPAVAVPPPGRLRPAAAGPEPRRCHIVVVLTTTASHRRGCAGSLLLTGEADAPPREQRTARAGTSPADERRSAP